MNVLKKLLPDVAAIVLFVAISFAYFYPAVFEGRILAQHDAVAGIGAGREHQEYHQTHGKVTRWTNSLFSGMPTYQLAPGYDSSRTLNTVQDLYHLYLPTYVWYVFVMLLGFYILLRAFNFIVFLHHYCCRAYLEIRHIGIHTAYHCGYGAGLSWQILDGWNRDCAFRRTPDCVESLPDDLLFPLRDALYGNSVRREGMEGKNFPSVLESDGRAGDSGRIGCMYQLVEPVSHVPVQQGKYARQE